MALHFLGHHVVVGMRRRVLGVSGTVTGFALQIAVAFTESVEAEAGRRGIGIGRKTRISPNLQYAGCINCSLVTLAIVVAGLAIRLIQPVRPALPRLAICPWQL